MFMFYFILFFFLNVPLIDTVINYLIINIKKGRSWCERGNCKIIGKI